MDRVDSEINGAKTQESEIFSKMVRAGMRSYFFDVSVTRKNEYYITLTESIKRSNKERPYYEKHKIFIFEEDIEKISEVLKEAIACVSSLREERDKGKETDTDKSDANDVETSNFTDLKFEDLDE